MNPSLDELIKKAQEKYDSMTPEERDKMWEAQRRSYVVGEAGMGSDADEAAYRSALERGDKEELRRLDAEAELRMASARLAKL